MKCEEKCESTRLQLKNGLKELEDLINIINDIVKIYVNRLIKMKIDNKNWKVISHKKNKLDKKRQECQRCVDKLVKYQKQQKIEKVNVKEIMNEILSLKHDIIKLKKDFNEEIKQTSEIIFIHKINIPSDMESIISKNGDIFLIQGGKIIIDFSKKEYSSICPYICGQGYFNPETLKIQNICGTLKNVPLCSTDNKEIQVYFEDSNGNIKYTNLTPLELRICEELS